MIAACGGAQRHLPAPAELGRSHLALQACLLAQSGFRIFPLAPRSKKPLIARQSGGKGCHDATTDLDRIKHWWKARPNANIGIATGQGLVVLDVDGSEGEVSLKALIVAHGALPATITARTGTGGWHFYFTCQRNLGNSASRLGPKLDTRGHGGYVVGPPSTHPNGCSYRWLIGHAPDQIALAELPKWLERLLVPSTALKACPPIASIPVSDRYLSAAIEGVIRDVASAAPGTRNSTLYAGVRRLSDLGVSAANVERCLMPAALAAGLHPREVKLTLASANRVRSST